MPYIVESYWGSPSPEESFDDLDDATAHAIALVKNRNGDEDYNAVGVWMATPENYSLCAFVTVNGPATSEYVSVFTVNRNVK